VTDFGESRVQVLTQRAAQINEFFARQQPHAPGAGSAGPGDNAAVSAGKAAASQKSPGGADARAAAVRGSGGLPARLRWHMIGHLQRNKIKAVLPIVSLIHSVDSLRLAEELELQAEKMAAVGAASGSAGGGLRSGKIPVLMQINASEEKSKHGVAVGASVHLAEQIDTMPHLQLVGLMSMGPLPSSAAASGTPANVPGEDDPARAAARVVFARTREVFEEMKWHKIGGTAFRHLSMGMSHDFEQAILEGATMVRVGTALFGGKLEGGEEDDE
jgi:pyridoxal phosphate enzyme (YggS family)